jgi:hypothetical protein
MLQNQQCRSLQIKTTHPSFSKTVRLLIFTGEFVNFRMPRYQTVELVDLQLQMKN